MHATRLRRGRPARPPTAMREHPSRARLDARGASVVLPAEGATLATSLSGGLMLVAHTGRAHLGIPVDRTVLRDITRAQAFLDDGHPDADVDLPEAVPFRHATSHTVVVSEGQVHLTLHAMDDPGKTDVHVELRLKRPILRGLAQYYDRLRRRRLLTVAGCLAAIGVIVAVLGCLA